MWSKADKSRGGNWLQIQGVIQNLLRSHLIPYYYRNTGYVRVLLHISIEGMELEWEFQRAWV